MQALELRASDYVRRQLFVTPFVREDIGWLIEQCREEVLMSSSDYPHPEGSKDPIGLFEATMDGVGESARDRFYERDVAEPMGDALV